MEGIIFSSFQKFISEKIHHHENLVDKEPPADFEVNHQNISFPVPMTMHTSNGSPSKQEQVTKSRNGSWHKLPRLHIDIILLQEFSIFLTLDDLSHPYIFV